MKAQRYGGTLTAVEEILGTGHLDSSGTSGHDRSWIGNIDDGSEGMALVSGVGSSMYWEITRGRPEGLPVTCVDMRGDARVTEANRTGCARMAGTLAGHV